MFEVGSKDIFHVHTYRCGHAEMVSDEEYVRKAISMCAPAITFTDHAPFPGDPFRNRMSYVQLDEYIENLQGLKVKYEGRIAIHIGLEIEYLPSFRSYYEDLRAKPEIEVMLLGQHMYETNNGKYSFELEFDDLKEKNSILTHGLMDAQIDAIKTGLFDFVAHPDRCIGRQMKWDDFIKQKSISLINEVEKKRIPLERNLSSMHHKGQYWEEFWSLVTDDVKIITGYDAHSLEDLDLQG